MSQKLLRIFTIIGTALLTLGLLIGGSYLYQKVLYTDPLESTITGIPAIGSFQMERGHSRSKIKVQFNVNDKLRANFYLLLDQLENQSANDLQNVTLEISNVDDVILERFLTDSRLPIFEALSTGQFTELPSNLQSIAEGHGVTYDLEVDNNFIFLTGINGNKTAHIAINRGSSPLNIVNTMGGEYL